MAGRIFLDPKTCLPEKAFSNARLSLHCPAALEDKTCNSFNEFIAGAEIGGKVALEAPSREQLIGVTTTAWSTLLGT